MNYMKKYIFISLITILLVLILFYFYDKREDILNKKYINNKNIHIEYPYFNNIIIDNYIKSSIEPYQHNNNLTFIDYDYTKEKEIITLTIYIHEEYNNIEKEIKKTFSINPTIGEIITIKKDFMQEKEKDFYQGKDIDPNLPLIALTFDDGPNNNTIKVLNILKKYNVKATFFILGQNIENHENIILKMKELNMQIGNHMYTHKLIKNLKEKEMIEEINLTDNKIKNITNQTPTIIRPSYGSYNQKLTNNINRPIITWNIDTLDWKYHNSKKIYQTVINKVKDGDIILMHDIYTATANSLELIIPELLQKGFQLVTINDLFQYKNIPKEKGKVYRYIK